MISPFRVRPSAARRLALALLPAALLAACGGAVASRTPVDRVPLDAESFAFRGVGYRTGAEPGMVGILAKLEERDGRTVLCGAYMEKGDFQLLDFDILAEVLGRTEIYVGEVRLLSDIDGFAGPLPWGENVGREANCLPTDLPWTPAYADPERLRIEFPEKIIRKG
ncbi:hypothetical protein P2H44_02475 [Albimonas sp. CAU 1670]|uniref:hypothetical protein n=1 Tax=Albimonas sp. CAU 1670 TaxID=3032599 RepID=UPI0023DA4E42|nr:hypothetical protein [Albimonas sp. CAU 1670]MDF2231409.1 hypothetical protein [Albimonas sp. CAU 1670]